MGIVFFKHTSISLGILGFHENWNVSQARRGNSMKLEMEKAKPKNIFDHNNHGFTLHYQLPNAFLSLLYFTISIVNSNV